MTKNNEEKAKKITDRIFESGFNTNRTFYDMAKNAAMEMARWKDEQYKEREDGLREIIYALNSYIDGQIKYLEDKKL